VPDIPAGALMIAGDRDGAEAVYFKLGTTHASNHPNGTRNRTKTIFNLDALQGFAPVNCSDWTVADVDFDQMTVCPRKQADDRTRELRELKTKRSRTPIPITQETATVPSSLLGKPLEGKPTRTTVPEPLRATA